MVLSLLATGIPEKLIVSRVIWISRQSVDGKAVPQVNAIDSISYRISPSKIGGRSCPLKLLV